MDMFKEIYELGIIPVVAIDDADKAVPLAKALRDGGLPAAEITFRTAAAEEAIRRITAECPDVLVGAGTVLTKEQCDRAIAAGAKFVVTPGFNPEMIAYIKSTGIPMMPGAATPGEMEQAMSMGLTNIKFFPAEANGGVNKLKALAGPYQAAKWMPTGGVNTKNLNDYLSFDRILCCGGTWIATSADINEGKWDDITRKCKEAIKTMLGFRLEKICIYGDSANAEKNAQLVASLFGFDKAETECGVQAGALCFGKEESDAKGCIVISTLNGDRAMSYLKRMGAEIDPDIWYDKKGKVSCFGLKDTVAGYEICIETK